MIRFSVLLSFAICLSVSLNAQSSKPPVSYGIDVNFDVPNGLKPGENAPLFIAKDTNGSTVDLKEELKNGSVVLIFYRGEWCPVCNRYLSNFQDSLSYVTSAGAKVFAITPEVASSADKMIEKTGATFTVVPDPTEEIMKSFDVLFSVTETYQEKIRTKLKSDIATNNAKDEAHLPVPATYIINQQGVIVYRQFDLDYHKRASVRDILTNIPK